MENLETTKVTLDSDCTCVSETGDYTECFGCWEDSLYDLNWLVETVQADKGWTDETEVNVEFKGVSWRRVSGDFVMEFNAKDLLSKFSLNGDFKLVFTYTDGELALVRYSHDEPMGTGKITFKAV
jgi:hypothetical protein